MIAKKALSTAGLAGLLAASAPAHAVFFTAVCNDLACGGGDDFLIQDNAAGDLVGTTGAINYFISAFGYSLVVNTAQSKPVIGSSTSPQVDLTFTATTSTSATQNIFLYASDTDFTLGGPFRLSLGGSSSDGAQTTVTGRAWGGTSNTALQFSGANLLSNTGLLGGPSFSTTATGSFTPTVNPYSLTIGVAIVRSSPGTTTGDLNFTVTPIPEPQTYALMLAGLGAIGFMARRRRTR